MRSRFLTQNLKLGPSQSAMGRTSIRSYSGSMQICFKTCSTSSWTTDSVIIAGPPNFFDRTACRLLIPWHKKSLSSTKKPVLTRRAGGDDASLTLSIGSSVSNYFFLLEPLFLLFFFAASCSACCCLREFPCGVKRLAFEAFEPRVCCWAMKSPFRLV